MIPHSYAMDSQNKAQELVSMILASSSPPTIFAACTAIETFLQKHTADQCRSFFSIAFPALICKIFGFDESSPHISRSSASNGWIDQIQASNNSELERRVFNLLSPAGVLLSSVSSVDRHSLVKYVFPVERLPEWVRFMLQSERDCRVLPDLCPLFKGRIKEDSVKGSYQVQLNVFEYYMFWFAYYPVSVRKSDNSDAVVARKTRKFRLESWTSSFPVLAGATGDPGQKTERGLYIRLLYAYLQTFVPNYGSEAYQPYRSSLLHYSSGHDGSVLLQMEFMVYTLIHFWLVDNDFSPLPMSLCRSFGLSFPFRAVLGDIPPTSGLGGVVTLFVKYLNVSLFALNRGYEPVEYTGSPRWKISGSIDVVKSPVAVSQISSGSSVALWNSLIQRPLYRFILRTFLFCPMGTSMTNVSQVFSLWISYMEPWKISLEDFVEFDAFIDRSTEYSRNEKIQTPIKKNTKGDCCQSTSGYDSSWEGYALSNYLFYSSLIMHFLGFAHKFLHTDAVSIIQMVLKLLNILTSSKELMDLIKKVDAAFHSKPSGSSFLMFDSSYKCIPSIHEQLQDWEDGLCESDADGSFLHENWNQDLRLLSDGEDGGHQLLQLLILRAEPEIQAKSGNNLLQNIRTLDSLKAQMGYLFGGSVRGSRSVTPEVKQGRNIQNEIFKPRWVGNHKLTDANYKGDRMMRPILDGEVAWLARLLVRLSDWLNEILKLNQGQSSHTNPSWLYVDVSNGDISKVGGPKEAMKMLLCSVGCWLVLLGVAVLRFMREHGLRVNLRVFASKKVVIFLLLSCVFSVLKKAFGLHLYPPSHRRTSSLNQKP